MHHSWEDVSYHGSPVYQCEFCGVYKSSKDAHLSCPKAEEILERRRKDQEMKEKCEYASMKAKIERFKFLENKYGTSKTDESQLINIIL